MQRHQSFHTSRSLFAACLLGSTGALTGIAASAAEPVRFEFAPPNGTAFVQRLTTEKRKTLNSGQSQTDAAETATRVTIERTADGWNVRTEPLSMTMTRDGAVVDNPLSRLLSSAVVTYHLDASGRVRDVSGFDTFFATLQAELPAEVVATLGKALSVEALKAREIAEWSGRVGDFVGLETEIGAQHATTVPYPLPDGGVLNYEMAVQIAGFESCAPGRCVRVKQTYDSNAREIAEMSAAAVDAAQAAAAPEQRVSIDASKASVSGNVSRLLDPDTMLIYDETSTRVITMTMSVAGSPPGTVTMTETRRYEFLYE